MSKTMDQRFTDFEIANDLKLSPSCRRHLEAKRILDTFDKSDPYIENINIENLRSKIIDGIYRYDDSYSAARQGNLEQFSALQKSLVEWSIELATEASKLEERLETRIRDEQNRKIENKKHWLNFFSPYIILALSSTYIYFLDNKFKEKALELEEKTVRIQNLLEESRLAYATLSVKISDLENRLNKSSTKLRMKESSR